LLENIVEQKTVGICSTTLTRESLIKIALKAASAAPFQRSDEGVFPDLFLGLRLVPLNFQR